METEQTVDASSSPISMKRKIDEVFDALDDAMYPKDRPSPPKRANTSIYGSLEKYGIQSFNKPSAKLKSTPTLSALLSRSRSRTQRKSLVMPQVMKSSTSIPDYSPSSTEAFLQRLSTYSLSTYPSKPPQIDAVAASKAGWINEGGKDRLFCSICKVGWLIAGREGMNRDAGNALVAKQEKLLIDMHKEGCPWRVRQCDPLVYRIPLQSPTALARQIKLQANEIEAVMDGIAIQHPLSSSQVLSLVRSISSVSTQDTTATSPPASPDGPDAVSSTSSTNSILTSLFGWTLAPAPQPLALKSASSDLATARTHSRAMSVPSTVGSSREGTPTPSAAGTTTPVTPCFKRNSNLRSAANDGRGDVGSPCTRDTVTPHRDPPQQRDALLQCRMCQRRVGLWAFTISSASASKQSPSAGRPQRHFDILREHRSYCPYVVKSTPLPTVPTYPDTSSQPTPRSSFVLSRTSTLPSVAEGQSSTSTFNLRRTASLISGGVSSFTRTGTIPASMPSVPVEQSHNLTEGWRAVLSVVLRYGIAERSRMPASPTASAQRHDTESRVVTEKDEGDVMSGVVALVDGVKKHGGKQLLSYVRNLLG